MSINLMQASRQWATRPQDQRFQTLSALFDAVNGRRLRSRSSDITITSVEAKATPDNNITLNHGIKAVQPSHWSFGQLSGWIKAPAEYLRRLPAPLAVANINHGIQSAGLGDLKFMTVISSDGSLNILQAVTSTKYGRIWDADVVSSAVRIVERSNGKFYNPKAYDPATGVPVPSGLYASDRDVFIFMIDGGSVLDVGPRAQLNRGFFMWNSETGARTFGLTTFLFNMCCGNHIVWGAQNIQDLRIRHTQNGPYRFDSEAMPGLLAYVDASAAPEVTAIKKAQDFLLPATQDLVVAWLQARKFTKTEATESFETAVKEEGECRTLWNVIQGATAYARGFDFIDARVELETKAGKLMEIVS